MIFCCLEDLDEYWTVFFYKNKENNFNQYNYLSPLFFIVYEHLLFHEYFFFYSSLESLPSSVLILILKNYLLQSPHFFNHIYLTFNKVKFFRILLFKLNYSHLCLPSSFLGCANLIAWFCLFFESYHILEAKKMFILWSRLNSLPFIFIFFVIFSSWINLIGKISLSPNFSISKFLP